MNQYRYDISKKKKKARAGEIRLIFWIFVPSDKDNGRHWDRRLGYW